MLEAHIRAQYRPDVVGSPSIHLIERGIPDLDSLLELANAAARSGSSELHVLACEYPPDVRSRLAELATGCAIPIRFVWIPREALTAPSKKPPVFREVGELSVGRISHSNGAQDVELRRFLPGLPISPTRAPTILAQHANTAGLDFIDYWSVDFDYQPGGPFQHHWRCGRSPQQRRIRLRSEAMWPSASCGRIAVKVADVFGYETVTLLASEEAAAISRQ